MELRELLKQKLDADAAQKAETKRYLAERTRDEANRTFDRLFPNVPFRAFGVDGIYADGVDLRYVPRGKSDRGPWDDSFAVIGTCPKCGAKTQSDAHHSVLKIAELVDVFTPGWEHRCESSPETTSQTLGERLEELIREIVQEELP